MDFLTTLPIAPAATSLAVLVLLVVFLWPEKNKRYTPIAGTVLHQLINFHRVHHYMTELACKYKTFRMLGFLRTVVYTADPANVEYVYKTNFANYGKGVYLHDILSDSLGDGIFAVDGDKWLHQRKTSSSQFSTKVLRDFSSEIFKTNGLKLAGIIHQAANCNKSIDIQVSLQCLRDHILHIAVYIVYFVCLADRFITCCYFCWNKDLFMKSTLDSIVKILLGFDLDTLSGTNNDESIRFSNAADDSNGATLYRVFDIFWKIKRFLNIGSEAMIRENIKVVDQFIYKLINRKIETLQNSEDDELPVSYMRQVKKRDFISRLIETRETDPKYLRDMVLSFIAAGKDTTGSALSWFFYMMCKHPKIQEKIAQEVREATGLNNTSSADEVAAKLTEEALNKMQYLHAALTETLRLYPAVPMNSKVCFSDDTWPDGTSVNKGQGVMFLPYAMGRMAFIWGDDAKEFRPERWLDENGIFREENPFKFLAFNAGPRICLGKDYGYIQMKIFAAILLSSYIFTLDDKNDVLKYKTMITLYISNGLHVLASPRV
uniref:cytochrome P450 704C1-like isoform X1 n=1 Tax=Fragaria vesca subsp. vesca TaxID=101020 RepID=UPI0005C94819|nr:PREDICTED: cytochrome P450 704C1-like isoform X1 [Fragaria vesca subsp. vesca]